jgi:crotonobetainyl-CoA:carnitine CoA-transferase CaiB-like acyl-CoA transferase
MSGTAAPLRVLDLTDDLALGAGRHFVGLGADVVRIGVMSALDGADGLHWYAGQRVLPDVDDEWLRRLAEAADVVLESGVPRALRGIDLTVDGPRSRFPSAVHVVVTPFGLTGPRRDWRASELVVAAAGGMAWLGGRPDGPPTPPPRQPAGQLAGSHAAIGALLALSARRHGVRGQLVDISAQEAVAATLETGTIAWLAAGTLPRRSGGVYAHVAHRIFPAADGHVAGGYSGSERMWTDLLAWLVEEGEADDLTDPVWADPEHRWMHRAHVDGIVTRFTRHRSARTLAEQARERALPWAEVVSAADLLANPQLRDRGFFVAIRLRDGSVVRDVGFPTRSTITALAPAQRVEHVGWLPRPLRPSGPRCAGLDNQAGGALSGLRVLDLTWVLAGPYATKQLAEHGADVIKIESRNRHDPTRFAPGMRLRPGAGPDDGAYFLNFNRNKRSVALNLRDPRGVDLVRQMARCCDVVIDNYAPGVTARWGLDHAALVAEHPNVIVVSMSGVGATGPWRRAVTFADTLAAMSGLTAETAEAGGPPQGLTFGLGDMIAANAAVIAVLDLVGRGRGGAVDLSQLEAMAAAMGPALLEAQLGTSADDPVPNGVYPTAGDDRWVALTVSDEQAWKGLVCAVPALGSWAAADRLARRAAADAIDVALAGWTVGYEAGPLADALQRAGVAASVVATGADLADADPHLAARGFFVELEHPTAGPVRHEGIVARLSVTPGRLDRVAPRLGGDTEDVLGELLGIDRAGYAELLAAGVLQ